MPPEHADESPYKDLQMMFSLKASVAARIGGETLSRAALKKFGSRGLVG